MPPRFLERLERQSQACKECFGGQPRFDPPPYSSSSQSVKPSISEAAHSPQQSPPPRYSRIGYFERPSLALPPDSLVLVTGANGWQGMHVVDQLLEHGYRVRGTVRDSDKAVWTAKYFADKYGTGRFSTAIIPDMVPRGAFDMAAKGCAGVIHCASVTRLSADPAEIIVPTIAGALNVLEAAAREPQVQRFVYCSSTTAAVNAGDGSRSDVTSDSWNMSSFLTAWQAPPYGLDRAWAVYSSSKLQTEQAVWRWYSDHRPHFALNTVLPSSLFGRQLAPKYQGYRATVGLFKLIWDGNAAATAWAPPQYFVDVQDSALLHIAALLMPDIQNQRIFAARTPYNINSILFLLRSLYPYRVFEGDVSDHGVDMTHFRESSQAEALLRRMGKKGFTDIETSIQRMCATFLEE